MGIENQCFPTASPEHIVHKIRNVKLIPTVEMYRPPAARRARLEKSPAGLSPIENTASDACTKTNRQKRPDRAVYIPRHRRSVLEVDSVSDIVQENRLKPSKDVLHVDLKSSIDRIVNEQMISKEPKEISAIVIDKIFENASDKVFVKQSTPVVDYAVDNIEEEIKLGLALDTKHSSWNKSQENEEKGKRDEESFDYQRNKNISNETADDNSKSFSENQIDFSSTTTLYNKPDVFCDSENMAVELNAISSPLKLENKPCNDNKLVKQTLISEVLIISSSVDEMESNSTKPFASVIPMIPQEKKAKKVERSKSKPAPPPLPTSKINRDECDWESLFDDNGDCLDPALIEELTSSVGEVVIEKPKCSYKTYSRSVEVSSDEFAHVLEIYNFPSEFKSSDLAAVFSSFKNGGFELKWVDDTHCLGVFSSPLVAAEVLASDHPFVKTRPLSEATALSKTKARRSSEFLQPYRSRPETCAALARRLVTKSLGVTLATARQEREQEKIVLREAKERKRLANKQREDVWEGIIAEKPTS